ncbi:MAG TPA: TIM barrel protein [Candidatus Limnocylindrales bacterium]|nr:TIM barrel protein [Candidatus Limnocylindrales bacterium]
MIGVAAAPVSWGVFELTTEDPRIPGPELVLDQIVAAGYAGTELGPPGFLGTAEEVRRRLEGRGLALVGAFLPVRLTDEAGFAADLRWLDEILAFLDAAAPTPVRPKAVLADAGSAERRAYAGRIDRHPELQLAGETLATALANLHRAAERARAAGLEPVLHPHAGTWVETADEIRAVADRLDPALVGLCLDTGHVRFGGADPVGLARDYWPLVRHVHLKDVDGVVLDELRRDGFGIEEAWRRGIFSSLATGIADIPGVVETLRSGGYDGWVVVEQDRILSDADTPESLLAAARQNREILRRLGL